ncbi:MAG: tetratricopeptide repeat protein [Acidobacteriota bacterium]|nr:tetratricopeptide repeat protein [Acidobacteriota bacterium]
MKNKISVVFSLVLFSSQSIFAQIDKTPQPPPPSKSSDAPKLSETLSKNLSQLPPQTEIPRERRQQAYAKLLEGQRYLWSMNPQHAKSNVADNARLAKESLQQAVELDPTLAEGYTALAELNLNVSPRDFEESILLANIAVKINPDNFGGHRILSRLYTIKSKLNYGVLDEINTAKAISEWKEIARLDPRNAEAFAFLSEFYARTNRRAEQTDALRRWLAAAAPLEPRFYQTITGGESDLSPESASLKLGGVLLDAGETREAVEILSRTIADNPENTRAIELLREAVEAADESSAVVAAQALSQAVYANPENTSLIALLAQTQARAGNIDEAARILRDSSRKLAESDKTSAANLQIALGDIYFNADRFNDALTVYENALKARGINSGNLIQDDERDFAIRTFERMIQTYKKANRPNDVKILIERSRGLLGKQDLFPDRQLIMFYRETGKTLEALQVVRSLRARDSVDYGLLRLEASILTDAGKVDEAVALIKPLIDKKKIAGNLADGNKTSVMSVPMYDDFTNYLFISSLYNQAKRGKEAVEAANQAIAIGQGAERKQIAKLTLATAQQTSGNFQAAEETLRGLLQQSPGNPIALNNLGYFLAERDTKLDEALTLIERAVKIDPTNSSYLDSLGWAYFKLGNYAQAEKYLKQALRFDSTSATIHEHLGDVYQKQGKLALAKISWQKSITISIESEQILRLKSKLNSIIINHLF